MLFNQKIKKVELKYNNLNLIYEKSQEKQEKENNNVEIISYTVYDIISTLFFPSSCFSCIFS